MKENLRRILLVAIPFFLLITAIGYTIAGVFAEDIDQSEDERLIEINLQIAEQELIKKKALPECAKVEAATLEKQRLEAEKVPLVHGFQSDQQ